MNSEAALIEGTIIKSTGSRYSVFTKSGETFECVTGGKLRLKNSRITNPVAVGDIVKIEIENEIGTIKEICPRKNYIIRKASNLSREAHVIAANVDLAILIVTIKFPDTLTTFIDRFLVSLEAYRIPSVILFNKIDIYEAKEQARLGELTYIYTKAGYKCIPVSAEKNINIDAVRSVIANHTVVISGHSGVGKSTLIKQLVPGSLVRTSNISDAHNRGKHTTTHYEMYVTPENGKIIDTPGIKGFGLVDIEKNELFHFFPEFFRLSSECRYYNCTHLNEPDCAVKSAIESGEISASRYDSYLSILNNDESKHRSG